MANKLRLIIYQSKSSLKKRKQQVQLNPNSAAKLCQLRIHVLENDPKLNHQEKVSTNNRFKNIKFYGTTQTHH